MLRTRLDWRRVNTIDQQHHGMSRKSTRNTRVSPAMRSTCSNQYNALEIPTRNNIRYHHDKEMLSALLALREGDPPVDPQTQQRVCAAKFRSFL